MRDDEAVYNAEAAAAIPESGRAMMSGRPKTMGGSRTRAPMQENGTAAAEAARALQTSVDMRMTLRVTASLRAKCAQGSLEDRPWAVH